MNVTSKIAGATDYRLEEQVGYLLRLTSQRHALIFQNHSVDALTPPQFTTMIRLSEVGEVSQNELGRLVSIDGATIKGVVDRLRDKGLLRSRRCAQDRRRALISLTEKGKALIGDLKAAGRKISSETLAPLSPSERQTLVSLLQRIS